jgi:hypothetical protein
MDFMIMDSAGNAVESFESDSDATRALLEMAESDERAAKHLALLAFDGDGNVVGDPLTVADLRPEAATTLVMSGDVWITRGALTVLSRSAGIAAKLPKVLGAGR